MGKSVPGEDTSARRLFRRAILVSAIALAPILLTIPAAAQVPASAYKAPRLKGTTNPDLNGLRLGTSLHHAYFQ